MKMTAKNYRAVKKRISPVFSFMVLLIIICFIYIIGKIFNIDNYVSFIKSTLPFSVFANQNEEAVNAFNSDGFSIMNKGIFSEPEKAEDFLPTMANIDEIESFNEVKKYLYTIDDTAYVDENLLDIKSLLNIDVKTDISENPKVLIFHTHSQEDFIDSEVGNPEDTIVGVGSVLADILAKEYGIGVVHDFGQYDVVDGKTERGASYERMEPHVRDILEKYPTIEIMIDLHRDGVRDDLRLVTDINGEKIAKLMFFNGVVCENDGESGKKVDSLPNPYLDENLAFSLKMQLRANELYPGLTRKIYIKPYRYSLHMLPKSLLIEVGANTNTVAEVKNAMKPLAKILAEVIK